MATAAFHCIKFYSYFRNPETLYYCLNHNIIVRQNRPVNAFLIFFLLFLSGDIQLNSCPADTKSFYFISFCYFIMTNNFIVFQT